MFFKKKPQKVDNGDKKIQMPPGLWVSCPGCKEIVYRAEMERNRRVCPKCRYHFRLNSVERLEMLLDSGSFAKMDENVLPKDPLGFKDRKRYSERIKTTHNQYPYLTEAIVCGSGEIGRYPVEVGVFDFDFMGGSMASVVGERIYRAADRAVSNRCPLLLVTSSGGARMQEGLISLMQMSKTTAAVAATREAGIPYFSLLTDPTTGGVTASFAMQADVIMAEPGALIGFAGPRVIQQTINQELPDGFQRAEFLLDHGMIDMIVPRGELRSTIIRLMEIFYGPPPQGKTADTDR